MASSLARFRCTLKATPENVKCPYTKPVKDTTKDEEFPLFTKKLYLSAFPVLESEKRRDDVLECDPKEFFDIRTCIGSGRMGKTYVGYRPDFTKRACVYVPKKDPEKLVALMQMSSATVDYVDAVRILEPFTLYKHKQHPLICKALLSFCSRLPYQIVNFYILNEYWRGQTSLCKRLQKVGQMSEDDAKFYISELADALIFIHGYGKIVRRLCTCSLVIRPTGHLLLAPYSMCEQNLHCGQPCNMLVKNCGDQFYASPEVVFGVDVQFATDWWSLGVILYQLLTGELPFNGKTLGDLGKAITEYDLQIPCTVAPVTAAFIKSLLHKDPRRRLGFGESGSRDVQRHPYNKGVRWPDVRFMANHPPFIAKSTGGFPLDVDVTEKHKCGADLKSGIHNFLDN